MLNPFAPEFNVPTPRSRTNSSSSAASSNSPATSLTSHFSSPGAKSASLVQHGSPPSKHSFARTASISPAATPSTSNPRSLTTVFSSDYQSGNSNYLIPPITIPAHPPFPSPYGIASHFPDRKAVDTLSSMELTTIEFSQEYYLRRAWELGIAVKLAAPVPPSRPRLRHSPPPHKVNVEFLYDEVTITPTKSASTPKSDDLTSPWNDHVQQSPVTMVKPAIVAIGGKCRIVESQSQRKVKDWDWEPALPEMVTEVTWSENEEFEQGHSSDFLSEKMELAPELFDKHGRKGKRSNMKTIYRDGAAESPSNNILVETGKKKGKGKREVEGARKETHPTGKSWMIVTERMYREYYGSLEY